MAAALLLRLATPQALDLLFAVLSLALFVLYHAWYYSWHLWLPAGGWEPLPGSPSKYHRLDMTGQTARQLFTQVNVRLKARPAPAATVQAAA